MISQRDWTRFNPASKRSCYQFKSLRRKTKVPLPSFSKELIVKESRLTHSNCYPHGLGAKNFNCKVNSTSSLRSLMSLGIALGRSTKIFCYDAQQPFWSVV